MTHASVDQARDADVVTLLDVLAAARRIAPYVQRTPLERSAHLSDALGADVWLKLECFQTTGSFKLRGALNALLALDDEARQRGVVTASAGNHGLGVATGGQSDRPAVRRRRAGDGLSREGRPAPSDRLRADPPRAGLRRRRGPRHRPGRDPRARPSSRRTITRPSWRAAARSPWRSWRRCRRPTCWSSRREAAG